jgi:hypothetical protein
MADQPPRDPLPCATAKATPTGSINNNQLNSSSRGGHQEQSTSSSPPAATVFPAGNTTVRNRRKKGKQGRTELKKRHIGEKEKRPFHHQCLHEAAAEREEHCWQQRTPENQQRRS